MMPIHGTFKNLEQFEPPLQEAQQDGDKLLSTAKVVFLCSGRSVTSLEPDPLCPQPLSTLLV
eukprot:766264-Hanusia_phi.AAC.2